MNHLTIIKQMQGDGLSLSINDEGQIDVAGEAAAVNRWLPQLRKHKPDIFTYLSAATVTDLTQTDELVIRNWLADIDEDDSLTVEQIIYRCKVNPEARQYFLVRCVKVSQASDHRRRCTECVNLKDGDCEAVRRGEIPDTGVVYRPWLGLPRRCDCFI